MTDHTTARDRLRRLRVPRQSLTALCASVVLAASVWTGWGLVDYVIRLNEERVDLTEQLERYRVAAVSERERSGWLCRPIDRRPGAWICIEPKG